MYIYIYICPLKPTQSNTQLTAAMEITGSDRPGSEEERRAPEVEIGVGGTMKKWLFYLMGKLKKLFHYTMFIEINYIYP